MKTTGKAVKNHTWHLIMLGILRLIAGPVLKILMGFRCKTEKGLRAPAIIIANHTSNLDPALVSVGFSDHMYFVASEHAFRAGLGSKLMSFIFAPIPINKVQTDASALKEMIRRLKAGYNICLFAEGNRSYNGVTGKMILATAKLVKISGAALITYRLEGGYFTTPRWGKIMRRGRMEGRVTGRYSAEEIKNMPVERVLELIEQGIHEDAYARQQENPIRYRGKDRAEHIETALYLCPLCKKIGTIHSKGDNFSCNCGLSAEYTETGMLAGVKGAPKLPFSTVTEWDKWQSEELERIVGNAGNGIICGDEDQQLFTVQSAAGKALIGEGTMCVSRSGFHCAGLDIPLKEISKFAIVGKMALLLMLKDGTQYEVRSVHPRSALKYTEILRILSCE